MCLFVVLLLVRVIISFALADMYALMHGPMLLYRPITFGRKLLCALVYVRSCFLIPSVVIFLIFFSYYYLPFSRRGAYGLLVLDSMEEARPPPPPTRRCKTCQSLRELDNQRTVILFICFRRSP